MEVSPAAPSRIHPASLTAEWSNSGLYLPQLIDRRRGHVYYIRPRSKEEDKGLGTPHRALRERRKDTREVQIPIPRRLVVQRSVARRMERLQRDIETQKRFNSRTTRYALHSIMRGTLPTDVRAVSRTPVEDCG